jgi:hypothetical protein
MAAAGSFNATVSQRNAVQKVRTLPENGFFLDLLNEPFACVCPEPVLAKHLSTWRKCSNKHDVVRAGTDGGPQEPKGAQTKCKCDGAPAPIDPESYTPGVDSGLLFPNFPSVMNNYSIICQDRLGTKVKKG